MGRIFRKSIIVTFVSIVASIGAMAAFGVEISGMTLWMPIACSLLCAFPGSFWNFYQEDRLRRLNRELKIAHASLAAANATLEQKASSDAMTGFLNREAFLSAIERAHQNGSRGALLMVDADHFKQVNDAYGHLTGDDALMMIASAIRGSLRETDQVGRIGGEEFCVFLKGASLKVATDIAEQLRQRVEKLVFVPSQGKRHALTVSIGGEVCRPGTAIMEAMREADRRLYAAKHGGRNRVVMPEIATQAA